MVSSPNACSEAPRETTSLGALIFATHGTWAGMRGEPEAADCKGQTKQMWFDDGAKALLFCPQGYLTCTQERWRATPLVTTYHLHLQGAHLNVSGIKAISAVVTAIRKTNIILHVCRWLTAAKEENDGLFDFIGERATTWEQVSLVEGPKVPWVK